MLDRFKVPDAIAIRVLAENMRTTVENVFKGLGMPVADAEQAADVLIYADIRGIDSHGVSNMMPSYIAGFEAGRLNATPTPHTAMDAGAIVTVDCDQGLGLAVAPPVMDMAIDRARQHGVGVAIAFNAGHYGAAAYHAARALSHNMIGISMTTGGVQVAPTQGAEPLLGLNPIGIAAPSHHAVPYIFDASMSSLAANKIRLLRRVEGEALGGWIAGPDGAPIMTETPIPDDFLMLPLGGNREIGSHKGYGLMMMVEVLTSLLAGTGGGPFRRAGSAHYFMAYDIAKFSDVAQFRDDMDTYLQRLLDCKPAPGETRVVYPGIAEFEAEVDRTENGIPYHPDVIEWFRTTCDAMGVAHALS